MGGVVLTIRYEVNVPGDANAIATLFRDSGIHWPHDDLPRIAYMLARADLTAAAWDGDQLVEIARGLTDWCYGCYLWDLTVARATNALASARP